jgi:hypothetical protein
MRPARSFPGSAVSRTPTEGKINASCERARFDCGRGNFDSRIQHRRDQRVARYSIRAKIIAVVALLLVALTGMQRDATETGAASSQVLSAARSLSGDSSRLRLEVGKFLESVRAA